MKIAKVRITKSKSMFDVPSVYVEVEGKTGESKLFDFYPDEISFTEQELIGLTEAEAHCLKQQKDIAYLRS